MYKLNGDVKAPASALPDDGPSFCNCQAKPATRVSVATLVADMMPVSLVDAVALITDSLGKGAPLINVHELQHFICSIRVCCSYIAIPLAWHGHLACRTWWEQMLTQQCSSSCTAPTGAGCSAFTFTNRLLSISVVPLIDHADCLSKACTT
jgi:hypothetical protein